ncbi:MAG: carboxypeptidase-like regulatory domain-containing protein [Bacteroidota bacterium]
MKSFPPFLGVLFLFFLPLLVWGQNPDDLRIDAKFQDKLLYEAILELETQYPIQFYFAPQWIDSVFVSHEAKAQALDPFLKALLAETALSYYREGGSIILTQQTKILPLVASPIPSPKAASSAEEIESALFDREEEGPAEENLFSLETQLFEIGEEAKSQPNTKVKLYGYLKDINTGQALVGASVFKEGPVVGTLTDDFGYYVISLPPGTYEIQYRYAGRKDTRRQIALYTDGQLDVEMEEKIVALKEVQITSERSQVESVQTGVAKINIQTIQTTPTLLGEADVMKIALTLPGVQSVGEGSSGFNVRGGGTDQNLITIDDGVIYNPSHLFGFFSAFNPDVIKSADLYKSGLQAQYGGRVSSIFDVAIRDGNKKGFTMSGGISPLTSKLTFEGPIKRDTSSYIVGLRSTYSNWLLGLLDDPTLNNSSAFFADGIARVNHQFNEKNSVSLSLYRSQDEFSLNADTVFQYQNTSATLGFRHLFSNSFSSLFAVSVSQYEYEVESDRIASNAFNLDYGINQYSVSTDFDYYPASKHHIRFGAKLIGYDLNPGSYLPLGEQTARQAVNLPSERGIEGALYIGDEWNISPRFAVYGGLRFSAYALVGQGSVFNYADGLPREPEFIVDTTFYGANEIIQPYLGPELRLSGRYKLNTDLALKFSFDRTRQYIHMLTNSVAISPTDTWRLSNTYLPPQIGDQIALGLYYNIPQKGLEFSVETYYKRLVNLLEYKEGADLLVNEVIETDVINALGQNYGVEFLFSKKTGKLTGWFSYTYSRAFVQTQSPFQSEQINRGEYYPSNFDQPHKFTLISNYKFSRRLNFSFNVTYNTGRPTTLPIAQYQFNGTVIPFFADRNQFRIPDYFRIDLGLNIEGDHRVEKLLHSSFSFSVYNLTGRNNAYSVFSRIERGNIQTYQLSVFSRPIPTLTYTFEFR